MPRGGASAHQSRAVPAGGSRVAQGEQRNLAARRAYARCAEIADPAVCSFDQGRNVYAFLTLIDRAVVTDVLNTYLSQYNRDGFLMGNWDPYAPDA